MPTSNAAGKKKIKPMTSDEAAQKNLELAVEFDDFIVANPDELKKVPRRAKIVFMNGSKRLNNYNARLGRRICREENKPVFQARRVSKSRWDISPLSGCAN